VNNSPGQSACANYGTAVSTTRTVLVPIRAVKPIVGISAPSRIGLCDKYILDITSSSGGGGRAFTSIQFSVSTSNVLNPAAAVAAQVSYAFLSYFLLIIYLLAVLNLFCTCAVLAGPYGERFLPLSCNFMK
jgi:hypothetical protein